MKSVHIIILVLSFFTLSQAQSIPPPTRAKGLEDKISFTVSNGFVIGETHNSIIETFEESGFDAINLRKHKDFFGGYINTYLVKSRSTWTFEMAYHLNNRHSFNVAYGKLFHKEYEGRDPDANPFVYYGTYGHSFALQHKMKCISLYYAHSLMNGRFALGIGPQLGLYSLTQNFEPKTNTQKVKPGLHLSYSILIVDRSHLVLGFRSVYNLFMPLTIGPYEQSKVYYYENEPHEIKSSFQETKIPLSAFKFEILVGFKFNTRNN